MDWLIVLSLVFAVATVLYAARWLFTGSARVSPPVEMPEREHRRRRGSWRRSARVDEIELGEGKAARITSPTQLGARWA